MKNSILYSLLQYTTFFRPNSKIQKFYRLLNLNSNLILTIYDQLIFFKAQLALNTREQLFNLKFKLFLTLKLSVD